MLSVARIIILVLAFSCVGAKAQSEIIKFRYLRFSVSGDRVKEGQGWGNKTEDCSILIEELLGLALKQKATILLDRTITLAERDIEYVVESNESEIYYAASSNHVYSLEKWPVSVGTRLVVVKKYRKLHDVDTLCVEMWIKSCSLLKRREFSPFPALDVGEPILNNTESQFTGFFWDDEKGAWFLSQSGVDDDWVIEVCQVEKY